MDLSRAEGMPLLDGHRQDGLERVLGVVRGLRIEGGSLIATVQISERHDPIWRDIVNGIIGNVSIGYSPISHKDSERGGDRVRTLTRWQLHEISLVAVGADTTARVRSETMPDDNQNQNAAQDGQQTTTTATTATETRAGINQEIRALARTFDLPGDWSDDLIDRGATVEDARSAALDALRTRQTRAAPMARATVGASADDPAAFVTRAAEGLYAARVKPRSKTGTISENAALNLVKRFDPDITMHGFRSSFRTWSRKQGRYSYDVMELALAHEKDALTAAYERDDLLEERRPLMADWADFVTAGKGPVSLRARIKGQDGT
ncbi:MAG: HK97 family phage prohead protease [Loktanella sp.]|nr:HK97 family phage prohead protease [Loktanella sp.]